MICPCGLIYVGMTTRALKVRILEHASKIRTASDVPEEEWEQLESVPRHFRKFHNCDPTCLRVRGIDRVQLGIRGGDVKGALLRKETKWITLLNTVVPEGLNEYNSFKPFL